MLCLGTFLLLLICNNSIAQEGNPTQVSSQDNPNQVAMIVAVVVGDKLVDEATSTDVLITRGSGGCPVDTVARKGLPLCKGDKVKTSSTAGLKLLYGEPREKRELEDLVDVLKDSEIEISSVFCWGLCSWFASLHNRYINRTQHVALTNSSTVYQLDSREDKSATLIVYEGTVEVTKNNDQAAGNAGPVTTAECSSTTPETANNNIAPVVNALFKMTINENGSFGKCQKMTEGDLRDYLRNSSDVEIALHRSPAEIGGNVAKFVNFRNSAEREDAFRLARALSFWDPKDPSNFENLGKVYNDWGDAEQALTLFEKAYGLHDKQWQPSEELRINKAIAFRKLSQFALANDEINLVIANAQSKHIGDALNIRGSVFHDQARNKLTFDPSELSAVTKLLIDADSDYLQASKKGSTQLEYIKVNRGLILKSQGDVARRENHYQEAAEYYIQAILELMEAYGKKDNPGNKIASLAVAQTRASLANSYAALGKAKESEEARSNAEKTYIQLIADAEKEHQKVALAHCGLAALYLISERPEARENYDKCAAFNIAQSRIEVDVPYVVGLRRADAITVLAEAGLEPEVSKDLQVVSSQEPTGLAKPDTKIKLN
jgi:tetratricopeptide (TPR) repeat protein